MIVVTPRWCKSMDKQDNDQKKKDEMTNNHLKKKHYKETKDRVTRIELLVHLCMKISL